MHAVTSAKNAAKTMSESRSEGKGGRKGRRSSSKRGVSHEGSSRSVSREGSSRSVSREDSSRGLSRKSSRRQLARQESRRELKKAVSPEEALQQLALLKQEAMKGGPEALVGWTIATPKLGEQEGPDRAEGVVVAIERSLGSSTRHMVRFLSGDCEVLSLNRAKRRSIVGNLHAGHGHKVDFELLRQAEHGPVCSGVLLKLGRSGVRRWNKRHFQLNPLCGRLCYHVPGAQGKGAPPRGFLDLGREGSHAEVWSFAQEGKDPPDPAQLFSFAVVCGKRQMVIAASTQSEMAKWMAALRDSIDYWCGPKSLVRKTTAAALARKLELAESVRQESTHAAIDELVQMGSTQASLLLDVEHAVASMPGHARPLAAEDEGTLIVLEENMLEVSELLRADSVDLYDHIWDLVEALEAGKQDLADMVRACRLGEGGGSQQELESLYLDLHQCIDDAYSWLDEALQDAPEPAVELSSDEEEHEHRALHDDQDLPLFARRLRADGDANEVLHAEVSAGLESHEMKKWRKKSFSMAHMSSTLGSSVTVTWGEAIVTIIDMDARPIPIVGDFVQFALADGAFHQDAKVVRVKGIVNNVVMLDKPFDMGPGGTRMWRKWTPTEADRSAGHMRESAAASPPPSLAAPDPEEGTAAPARASPVAGRSDATASAAAPDTGAAAATASAPQKKPRKRSVAAPGASQPKAALPPADAMVAPLLPAETAAGPVSASVTEKAPRKRSTAATAAGDPAPTASVSPVPAAGAAATAAGGVDAVANSGSAPKAAAAKGGKRARKKSTGKATSSASVDDQATLGASQVASDPAQAASPPTGTAKAAASVTGGQRIGAGAAAAAPDDGGGDNEQVAESPTSRASPVQSKAAGRQRGKGGSAFDMSRSMMMQRMDSTRSTTSTISTSSVASSASERSGGKRGKKPRKRGMERMDSVVSDASTVSMSSVEINAKLRV